MRNTRRSIHTSHVVSKEGHSGQPESLSLNISLDVIYDLSLDLHWGGSSVLLWPTMSEQFLSSNLSATLLILSSDKKESITMLATRVVVGVWCTWHLKDIIRWFAEESGRGRIAITVEYTRDALRFWELRSVCCNSSHPLVISIASCAHTYEI